MNERIKQLAEQARAVKYEVDYQRDTYPTNLEELKKFAELIVKECCDQVRMVDAMEIKRHFGVEE
jgi:hypothetical protein